jgi:c-di-GMP-binding flagellar brake protein YcgR
MDVNISGSGIRFKTKERCNLGDFFAMRVEIPFRTKKVLKLLGEVVRMEPGDETGYAVGLRFVDISRKDQDQIINFVFKRQYELIDEKFNM